MRVQLIKCNKKECTEILEILNYIPLSDYLKIPREKISFFIENRDENYNFKYDISKPVSEQKISRRTFVVFLKLYLDYIADETIKEKIYEILRLNTLRKETCNKKL